MDRKRAGRMSGDHGMESRSGAEAIAEISIASRRKGFVRLRQTILDSSCPLILLTGEGGAGKTWLWSRVFESLPTNWHSVSVDMTSALTPAEFLSLAGGEFGLEPSQSLANSRLNLAGALSDESADGRAWVLTLEDAHGISLDVWEEVRAFSNRIGKNGGFAAIVLLAQTELIRRLSSRAFASFAGRIGEHLHLPPLDLDECETLIRESATDLQGLRSQRSLEEFHRDTRGNCGEILRRIRRESSGTKRRPMVEAPLPEVVALPKRSEVEPVEVKSPAPTESAELDQSKLTRNASPSTAHPPHDTPRPNLSLIPSRPPLRLEEGLIEVGWGGEESAAGSATDHETALNEEAMGTSPSSVSRFSKQSIFSGPDDEVADLTAASESNDWEAEPVEEWVEDPYAALQAWSEWSKSREQANHAPGDGAVTQPIAERGVEHHPNPRADEAADLFFDEAERDRPASGTTYGVTLRAEGQHEFSPYSQLFNENRKSKQP